MADRDAMLRIVDASPTAVADHDRERWLALFAERPRVQDPVGTTPHESRDALVRFYETFIAANDIRFEVLLDVVADGVVARDVIIHVDLPGGLHTEVPTRILYEIDPDGRIATLSAYWNAPSASVGLLRQGLRGVAAALGATWRMVRIQGLVATLRYTWQIRPRRSANATLDGLPVDRIRCGASASCIVTRGDERGIAFFDPGRPARVYFDASATSS